MAISGTNCTVPINGPFVNPASGLVQNIVSMTGSGWTLTLDFALDLINDGIIDITGDWANTVSSVVDIELGGTLPGNTIGTHDQINVSGIATLGGTLNITLIDSHRVLPELKLRVVLPWGVVTA